MKIYSLSNNMRNPRQLITTIMVGLAILSVSACEQKEPIKQQAPPPAVSVYEVNAKEIGGYREFVARTVAAKEVDLRARIEGELIARHFDEGSVVEQGQLLLEIDPEAYQASLAQAQADLKSRMSAARSSARDLKRGQEIVSQGYISQSDLDKLMTNTEQAAAAVSSAKAALKKAQLNLDYTKISAPFSGRIGKVNYNIGNIVSPSSNTLATLRATNPMHVNFQLEEAVYTSYLQQQRQVAQPQDVPIDIALRLPNNTEYELPGKLNFADTKVNSSTGTVEMRAIFDNPDGIILPGLFVTLVVESKNKTLMSLVPQVAVQENQQGKFVLIVNADNTVVSRHVELGRRINAMWVVDSGLKSGERVIIEGLQKVRTGIAVKPVEKQVDQLTGTISDTISDTKAGNQAATQE